MWGAHGGAPSVTPARPACPLTVIQGDSDQWFKVQAADRMRLSIEQLDGSGNVVTILCDSGERYLF